jgi:major vault protein
MVNKEDPSAIFSVRDFTGDACKAIASRIRGAVASESFDTFHKHSAKIIRGSVFGMNAGKVGEKFCFPNNGLSISNIDIQAVDPVDASTRESLQKSVSLAIAITSEAQEARARQDAFREEEQAKGLLERQKLSNEAQAEEERRNLLELKAKSSAIQSSGQAKAEATARAEALEIEALAQVKRAELKAEAMKIEMESELASLRKKHEVELAHKQALAELELEKAKRLADIETSKFSNAVKAIGAETIKDIARAGPEMQAKLLQGLGLNGYLVTDGKNPINLFNTAKGLIGANPVAGA